MNFKYIIRRILQLIPVLLLVSIFSFYLVNIAPGDPAESYRSPGMTEEQFEAIKEELGLNAPIHIQYIRWLGRIFKGDLGNSIVLRQSVAKLMGERLPATLGLMLAAIIFSLLVSVVLGITAGMNQGKPIDKVITGFTYVGISIPTFWYAIILIIVFSLNLSLFPSNGMTTTGVDTFWDKAYHAVLPILAISISKISTYTRYIRANVISQYGEEYVATAIAKGASPLGIVGKHLIKNCMLPIITLLGMDMGDIVTGSYVIESVFGWPGLGSLSLNAILGRDYPLMMGCTMLSCIVLISGNFIADIVCSFVDPRIRLEGRSADE